MLTDYKTPSRTQHNDGSWTVRYRAYEGDITTQDELADDGNLTPVFRYRRTQLLRDVVLRFSPMTEAQLIQKLNSRLAQSPTRTPIDEQRNA